MSPTSYQMTYPKINLGMYTSNLIILTALQDVCKLVCGEMRGMTFKTLVGPFKALPEPLEDAGKILLSVITESFHSYPHPTSQGMDHQFLIEHHGLVGFWCMTCPNFVKKYGQDNNWLMLDVSILNAFAIRGHAEGLSDRQKRDDAFYIRFLQLTWMQDFVMKEIIFARRRVEPRGTLKMDVVKNYPK